MPGPRIYPLLGVGSLREYRITPTCSTIMGPGQCSTVMGPAIYQTIEKTNSISLFLGGPIIVENHGPIIIENHGTQTSVISHGCNTSARSNWYMKLIRITMAKLSDNTLNVLSSRQKHAFSCSYLNVHETT